MPAGNGPYHPKSCANSDVSEIAGVTSSTNKDRIKMVQLLKNHQRLNTQSEDPRMIHQRNQAQIFVRSFSYTSTLFKVTSEGLQSNRTILKIYQKECLAAILKGQNILSRKYEVHKFHFHI